MPANWGLVKVNHINAVVDGYDDAVEHFTGRLGFQMNMPIPDRGDGVDACLVTLGGVMFELFAPKQRGERGQAKLLAQYGDHYIGIEYQVHDVPVARRVCEERGLRIINDPGPFFFTHPAATLGISWELWDGDWHLPRPQIPHFQAPHDPSYWRDVHPMGLSGLGRLTVAVRDAKAGYDVLQDLAGAEMIGPVSRPRAAARGFAVHVGDAVLELLEPTGDGPLGRYIERYGERIRSTVFRATDLARVEKHLAEQGIDLVAGDADAALAIPPAQNKNLLFEFEE